MRHWIYILLLLSSCNNKSENIFSYREYALSNSYKEKGRYINDTIKDGVFITYFPNGKFAAATVFQRDSLDNGIQISFYENGKIESLSIFDGIHNQLQVIYNEKGDTTIYNRKNKRYEFYSNNLFKSLTFKKFKLTYDSLGNIIEYKGSLDFLNREDSLVIANDYPDFVKGTKLFRKEVKAK